MDGQMSRFVGSASEAAAAAASSNSTSGSPTWGASASPAPNVSANVVRYEPQSTLDTPPASWSTADGDAFLAYICEVLDKNQFRVRYESDVGPTR